MSEHTLTQENQHQPIRRDKHLTTYNSVEELFIKLKDECNFPFLQRVESCFENFKLSAGNSSIQFTYRPLFGEGCGELYSPYPGVAVLMTAGTFFDQQKLSCVGQDMLSREDYLSMRLIDEGQTVINSGNLNKLLMPGDMFVYTYPSEESFKVTHTQNKVHRYTTIYFNKNSFANISDLIGISTPVVLEKLINSQNTEKHLFLLERSEMLTQLIHSFWICEHQGIYKGLSMRLKVAELLYLLAGTSPDSVNYHTESINFREANAIAAIREILDKEHRSPPSIAFLASKSGMNRNHLCNLFKQMYGFSIAQYCKAKRLELAYSLLSNTNDSVLNISKKCGYNHVSNFIRAFTSHYNISPNKLKHHVTR